MKRLLNVVAVVALAIFAVSVANADQFLTLTLDNPVQTANPGDHLSFTGFFTNTDPNPATLDETIPFFFPPSWFASYGTPTTCFPMTLQPGDSSADCVLLIVDVSTTAPLGSSFTG